jgi:uncharacterized protein
MITPPEITHEMLDELDEFLISDESPDDCMQISELDGFLAGIVVGPDLIMPGEWTPVFWSDGEPMFVDADQAERIMGTVMGRYNEIIRQLDHDPDSYAPILYGTPDGKMLAADWAEGFMAAFNLRVDSWNPLFADEDDSYLMGPIMAHLHDKDDKPFIAGTPDELEKIREESADALPYAIKEIYDFWKSRREPFGDLETPSNDNSRPYGRKVGRNESCPCGSGRKYKRCCGAI